VQDIPIRTGTVVLFLGLGLGYQVQKFRELHDRSASKTIIIIVERSEEVFSLLVKNRDLSFLEGTHLFIGDVQTQVHDLIESLSALSFTGSRIVKLRGCYALHRGYYDRIEAFFRENITGKVADLLTRFAFESLWVRNIIDNMPSLVGKRSIRGLQDVLRGHPVLVVNAGPSIYGQLAQIRELQKKVHIIAVDTVLTPLLLSGTVPDFVVTLDAGFFNALDFRRLYTGTWQTKFNKMCLIADLVVHPLILRHWSGALYFSEVSWGEENSASPMPLLEQFRKIYPSLYALDCGGSIATTAIELGLFMGADPVFVTGLDLSYIDYKTHVNSTALFDELYRRVTRLSTLDTSMIQRIGPRKKCLLPAIGSGSNPVLSDFVFTQYLRWIEDRNNYAERVVNCTARGATIGGLHHRKLDEMFEAEGAPTRKPIIHPGSEKLLSQSQALKYLLSLENSIEQALKEVNTHTEPSTLAGRHALIANLVMEGQRLHGTGDGLYSYLRLLLNFLKIHVHRAKTKVRQKE
jgi:hypothetical protein